MNLNCWIGSGRLTRDAELGQSRKGTSMSKFRIASNGRRDDETLFMNVLCFGKMAETLNDFLVKGRLVEIQGKLKVDDFEDAEGQQRRFLEGPTRYRTGRIRIPVYRRWRLDP